MTTPVSPSILAVDLEAIEATTGRIVVFVDTNGALDPAAARVDQLSQGAVARFAASEAFDKLKPGDAADLAYPAGMAAEAVQVVKLDQSPETAQARKAGAAIGRQGRQVCQSARATETHS